jgi:hypothetical protein
MSRLQTRQDLYAPAGTHSVAEHIILSYLTWRRREGPQMFMKYTGVKMEECDSLVAEWANTIRVEEIPTASTSKPDAPRHQTKKRFLTP